MASTYLASITTSITAEVYELLIEKLDDAELRLLIKARNNQKEVAVNIDEI